MKPLDAESLVYPMPRKTRSQWQPSPPGWKATRECHEDLAMVNRKSPQTAVEKISFRLFPPYTERIVEQATLAKVNPNQLARIATMAAADGGLLNLSERLQRIEDELIRLRRDFNQAIIVESE